MQPVLNRCVMRGVFVVGVLLCLEQEAHAYLDPGTGSFMLQMLIAALVGGTYALKIYWKRIRGVMSRVFKSKRPPDQPSDRKD